MPTPGTLVRKGLAKYGMTPAQLQDETAAADSASTGIGVAASATAKLEVLATGSVHGVNSTSASGTALIGTATTGDAIAGFTEGGYAVSGYSNESFSGFFESGDEDNTSATLVTKKVAAGAAADLFEAQNHAGVALFTITAAGGVITTLPTADPAVAGALWNDAGTVKVSAG